MSTRTQKRLVVAAIVGLSLAAGRLTQTAADPTFIVGQDKLANPTKIIAYGDTRFTDPSNVTATHPRARRALVAKIAEEKPDAVLISGDLPWHGADVNDYAVFQAETEVWRTKKLRIFPALGNHEFSQCEPQQCLENWWKALPDLAGRRWYSARLGDRIHSIALDSDTSLLPGSDQLKWLEKELAELPKRVQFVFITLHHPPVADVQTKSHVDHNPRPNEIALAAFLATAARGSAARFIVTAGHTHNYERFLQDDIVYLVSGGGGAPPYEVERTPADLYQDPSFPNYHYLRFDVTADLVKATMFRIVNPDVETPEFEVKDAFEVKAKPRQKS